MADEPKPAKPADKAPAPAPKGPDPFVEIVGFLILLFFASVLVNGVLRTLSASRIFSQGLSGFSPRGILLSHTRPIASLLNPIGVRVVETQEGDSPVFESAGGEKIGSQPLGAKGKILQGPVIIGTQKYWYVDFDAGTDGWVNENDIAFLEYEGPPTLFERLILIFYEAGFYLKILAFVVTVLAVLSVIYLYRGISRIRTEERKLLYPELAPTPTGIINPKWDRVLNHIESVNENDWRLAILESDIMLSDLVDSFGLPGDTLGERLKAVEKSDFQTIDNAWEAHKVRNRIAHEGSEFVLSQREARRVVELYRTIFEEFHII